MGRDLTSLWPRKRQKEPPEIQEQLDDLARRISAAGGVVPIDEKHDEAFIPR